MRSFRNRELGLRPQGSNFKSGVWRAVSPHSSHHPQEVLLAQFSIYVYTDGLNPPIYSCFLVHEQTRKCLWFLPDVSRNDELHKIRLISDEVLSYSIVTFLYTRVELWVMDLLLIDPLSQVLNLVILPCKCFIRRYPHMNQNLEMLK